ncbi:cation efflux protein [Lindgomyces ingoldianus]|uniref:Cation efflux protein n=1 Tax=Lindgomyces ingoldianus TaxID=673940 RepID=A0ACB6RI85_9PLEO|nr:cation efflux protein [Lindgomyces ingoldianus]KAF2478040.1 cation efflux protein [Lindgomyces ingoldianus]
MASTYALPLNTSAHTHGHGHSQSHYLSDRPPSWAGQVNGVSSGKKESTQSSAGHHHHRSELNGQLRAPEPSPYADSREHSHDHSRSTDSGFSLKPLMGGRPRGRPRGESDLGRPPTRKSNAAGNFGFSPIHETPAPPPSTSWLELPEALTALLIPLPFLFASLAYRTVVPQPRRHFTGLAPAHERLLESVTKESDTPSAAPWTLPGGSQFLYACTLSSTTLILVGIISKIRSLDQPLDRRKSFGGSESPGNALDVLRNLSSLGRMCNTIFGVLLPFYAAMHLGGAITAFVLLTAVTAGIGGFDHKPGKHMIWDSWKRTLRTRKVTCGILVLAAILHMLGSEGSLSVLSGHLALTASVLVIPPPFPTAGWSLVTGLKDSNESWNSRGSTRIALPKPSSPLTSSPEDTLLTIVAGVCLTVFTILFSIISSDSPSIARDPIVFSTLSVASATALIFFSIPSALRSQKKVGLALGCLLVIVFGGFESSNTWQGTLYLPLICALSFGAVSFDTKTPVPHAHSHGHSHSGHKHAHAHHDHHLHGNHSKLSELLIEQCTPGSIIHTIMIEKDSRRIAYFGVLNLSFMLIQFFYGFVSGSLGLLTDSIHMLFDCAGLGVGLAAAVMSKWPPNTRFPYGYGKVDTLSGFANGVFLMLVSVEIVFDAFERLWEGHELHRLNELLIVSVLGFLVNIVGLTAFGHAHHHGHSHDHDHDHDHSHGHSHENENMQGIFLHILADALGSVAVIISTLLTKYYGWSGWDPIASCIIALLIFFSAIPLVKSSGMRLLLSLPADVEYGIRNTLQELSSLRGVVGYTVPRFWLEDEGAAHAEVHAKEHKECNHGHSHHNDNHSHHNHGHSYGGHDSQSDSEPHSHHPHDHSNHHGQHDHSDHDHNHGPRQQKVLGVIHIIASRAANLEDVRERTVQFLKGRGMEVVVHVETEGEGRCWCGGGAKVA